MKKPLDRFSVQSETYKKYRPIYPNDLYEEVLGHVDQKNLSWDCGTGNGQVASVLAEFFERVEATDISQNQLDNAPKKKNINYSLQRAESTNFPEDHFDLITVAQAVHWFDLERFNKEVRRVGKDGGVVCLWGYNLLRVDKEIDLLIDEFDRDIVGPYWDVERRHIDSYYQTIPFDFEPIESKNSFRIETTWDRQHLEGYFNSWSCVQNYIREHSGINPVPDIMDRLDSLWPDGETKKITFPIFLKLGRIAK